MSYKYVSDNLKRIYSKALTLDTFNKQLLFVLSCSERLHADYELFSSIHEVEGKEQLVQIVSNLWTSLHGNLEISEVEIKNWLLEVDILVDEITSQTPTLYTDLALSSVSAILHILNFLLTNEKERIRSVIHMPINSIQSYLNNLGYPTNGYLSPELDNRFEEWIWSSPLIQEEIRLQVEIIEYIGEANEINEKNLADIRTLSKKTGLFSIERGLFLEKIG